MTTPCPCQSACGPEISPDTVAARSPLEITSRVVWRERYYTEWTLRCTNCGRRYRVRDDIAYWKTLYNWEPLDAD